MVKLLFNFCMNKILKNYFLSICLYPIKTVG